MSSIEAVNPDSTMDSGSVVSQRTLRIPKGFQALLEGFAREVLRSQPPDIYAFGAAYFDRMVQVRSGDSIPETTDVHNIDTVKDATPTATAEKVESEPYPTEIKDKQANGIIVPIQSAALDMDKQENTPKPETTAATAAAAAAEEEPIDIDLNDPDVQAAAAKIQKGWGSRRAAAGKSKELQQQQLPPPKAEEKLAEASDKPAEADEVVDIDLNDPEVKAAAAKIQKGWGIRKAAKQQTPQ